MRLYLSRLHFPVTTLGYGRRVGVWFQGCSIRCPGCISVDTWASGRGETTVEDVVAAILPWLGEADGITISGGEPFDQAEALEALLRRVRPRTGGDVLVFSGRSHEALTAVLGRMVGLIDAIITDPFDIQAPQTLSLRGSDNQRLYRLTPLGEVRYVDNGMPQDADGRALDLMIDDDGTVWMAGIPRRGDINRLRAFLQSQGFDASTTEAIPDSR